MHPFNICKYGADHLVAFVTYSVLSVTWKFLNGYEQPAGVSFAVRSMFLVVHSSCTASWCFFISGKSSNSTYSISIVLSRPQRGRKLVSRFTAREKARVCKTYITSLRTPASRIDPTQRLPGTRRRRRMSAIPLIVLNALSPHFSCCHSKLGMAVQPYPLPRCPLLVLGCLHPRSYPLICFDRGTRYLS